MFARREAVKTRVRIPNCVLMIGLPSKIAAGVRYRNIFLIFLIIIDHCEVGEIVNSSEELKTNVGFLSVKRIYVSFQ